MRHTFLMSELHAPAVLIPGEGTPFKLCRRPVGLERLYYEVRTTGLCEDKDDGIPELRKLRQEKYGHLLSRNYY